MNKTYWLYLLYGILIISCQKTETKTPINLAKPSFVISDVTIREGSTQLLEVQVSLIGQHKEEILIPYITVSGTAMAYDDYQYIEGGLSFMGTDSVQHQSIFIEIIEDDIHESTEYFHLVFTLDTTVVSMNDTLTIIIEDNDSTYTDNDFPGYVTSKYKEGWNLIWADEFSGESLDLSSWTQADKGNWYNNELQYYQPQNSTVADGLLTITAKKEVKSNHNYTSSRLWTKHKVFYKYGQIDIRAKLPYSKGLWPALWMMGENKDDVGWPQCG